MGPPDGEAERRDAHHRVRFPSAYVFCALSQEKKWITYVFSPSEMRRWWGGMGVVLETWGMHCSMQCIFVSFKPCQIAAILEENHCASFGPPFSRFYFWSHWCCFFCISAESITSVEWSPINSSLLAVASPDMVRSPTKSTRHTPRVSGDVLGFLG